MDWILFWTILAQVGILFLPFLLALYLTISVVRHAWYGPEQQKSALIYSTESNE